MKIKLKCRQICDIRIFGGNFARQYYVILVVPHSQYSNTVVVTPLLKKVNAKYATDIRTGQLGDGYHTHQET